MYMVNQIFGLIAIVCAIWVIYDVWTNNKRMNQTTKIVWTVCAIFFNILTAIIYYFIGKK